MKKILVATMALVMGMTLTAKADLLVEFGFDGSSTSPTAVHADLNSSAITLSTGAITYGSAQTTTWNSVPYVQGSGGWNGADFANSKFWEFTITADPGFFFSITDISFLHRETAALTDIQMVYAIDGTLVNSIPFSGSGTTASFSDSITGYTGLSAAVITIHGWGATSTGGDFRLDDILIEGQVIPEPGTMVLLGLGIGALAFIRRKLK